MDEGAQIFAEMFPNYFSTSDEQYHVICQNEKNEPQFIQLHVETTEENYVKSAKPVTRHRHPYYNNYQHPDPDPDPDPKRELDPEPIIDMNGYSVFLPRGSCRQPEVPLSWPRRKKNWRCLICGKEFGWQSSLRLHLKKHINTNTNTNTNTGSNSSDNHSANLKGMGLSLNGGMGPTDLISISTSHRRSWGCQFTGCYFTAKTKKLLNQHLKTHEEHHSRNGTCSTCEYQEKLERAMTKYLNQPVTTTTPIPTPFPTPTTLNFEPQMYKEYGYGFEPGHYHIFERELSKNQNHGDEFTFPFRPTDIYHHFPMPIQSYTNNNTSYIDTPEETCSSAASDITVKSEPPEPEPEPDVSPQFLCCSACDFTTTEQIDYKDHIVSSHEIVRYKCGLCQFTCSQQAPLVQHMRVYHVDGKEPFHRLRWSCDFY